MISHEDYILVMNLGGAEFLPEDVVLSIKTPSSLVFENVEIDEDTFKYADKGYYNIAIPKEYVCEIGTYVFMAEGYELEIIEERECLPKPLSSTPAPDVCIISGNVRNVSGRSDLFKNSSVYAYPVKLPNVVAGTITMGNRVFTRTDHDGYFSLPVIRGAKIRFEIPDAGVRFEAVIPDQDNIRIEDLIP